jgi:hypothetical protein
MPKCTGLHADLKSRKAETEKNRKAEKQKSRKEKTRKGARLNL